MLNSKANTTETTSTSNGGWSNPEKERTVTHSGHRQIVQITNTREKRDTCVFSICYCVGAKTSDELTDWLAD